MALLEKAIREEAERKRQEQLVLRRHQEADLQERYRLKQKELEEAAAEREAAARRQLLEDETIAEERRRILEQHAPLLKGFLPATVFRDLQEISSLSYNIQSQFQQHVRLQDDPDLW